MLGLLLLGVLAGFSFAKTVTFEWHLRWILAAPDGFVRPVISINGQWPPPTIDVDFGDQVIVNTYNELGNETATIHFHGMFQNGTAASDGAAGLNQCGIYPGTFFQYKFIANPPGTHWWHSHEKAQYPDGLRGKMIVHDRAWEQSLRVDEQIYFSVSDWWHEQNAFIVHNYLSPLNKNGSLPSPNSFLLNDSRNPPNLILQPNKRYLLRIVSLAGLVCGQFHIAGHTLTVVAIDGAPVHPAVTDTIAICAGQSYDVIVVGNSYKSKVDFIFKMATDMLTGPIPSNESRSVVGKIGLQGSSRPAPSPPNVYGYDSNGVTFFPSLLDFDWTAHGILDDATLVPLDNEPLFKNVNNRIGLRVNQLYYEGIGTRYSIGSQPYIKPRVPSLISAMTTGDLAFENTTYGPGTSPFILRHHDVVEIYMENNQIWPHPMHMHGHYFQIAGRGVGRWNGDERLLYRTPARRNNVVIPPFGWFLLRFRADNPGVWLFHCHIDLHLVGGMAAIMVEAPNLLQLQEALPIQNIKSCSADFKCAAGACNCRLNPLNEEQSQQQCNTVFNYLNPARFGALIPFF